MGDTIAQTRFESVSKHSNDLLLARGNTLRRQEDRLKLDELMALCTTLQNKNPLIMKKVWVRMHPNRRGLMLLMHMKKLPWLVFMMYVFASEEVFIAEQEVADEMEVDEEVVEVINTAKLIIDAAQVSDAGDIVNTSSATTTVSVDDITLAQAFEKNEKYKTQNERDKGKGILIEPMKPMNKKDLIRLDEETALNLQAEFDKEERLAREKAEKEEKANIALIETWEDIQAKIDADHQLAEKMQAQEQEDLSIEEKATIFQ
ncbi:hypothetical protein Tco_1305821 [Tanacetum coccineum]